MRDVFKCVNVVRNAAYLVSSVDLLAEFFTAMKCLESPMLHQMRRLKIYPTHDDVSPIMPSCVIDSLQHPHTSQIT